MGAPVDQRLPLNNIGCLANSCGSLPNCNFNAKCQLGQGSASLDKTRLIKYLVANVSLTGQGFTNLD